jgi:hypothetical protein
MRKKSPDREKPDLELFRLLDEAGIAMYGPFATPAAQNEEGLKAWFRPSSLPSIACAAHRTETRRASTPRRARQTHPFG